MFVIGLTVFCLLVGCWVAVHTKRDGGPSPVARGLGVAAVLFVTPFVVFLAVGSMLTGTLAAALTVVPVALLGLGVYVFAMGTVPARLRAIR
ncbi:hypothetical protein HAPAU_23800 [Halalkalicoccus paucihalophilus]|uniref:Uncharacterized protein n=1 Tax=Halalkalicoccus paucihalophilus TaxID=1008153 RepID=A0A151ADN2_9EURY|nr:hypothetical protein [Halalkalicoccus paucihalophilus]KYH25703.1 hypothetical protein HAPAU_23800 [Halalkalicoccus paucihalophilus]